MTANLVSHGCKLEKTVEGRVVSEDDECFWNCVHGTLGILDDSGRLSEDKIHDVVEKLIDEPELREVMEKSQTNCISQIDDTMNACKGSKMFNKCSWSDEEVVQALKAENYCQEDFEDLIKNQ
ncbi:uncharacterized protein LOC107039387 isoform X2 [Diachasma alloeum]|uniref:uncharacterized protein LOC107039387 isoform X2 n=1 Tax=Diachasma alloeum TaxID=454923 RepID=UPI0007382AFD|nr:uncharacterized protein LOC107039387 isoform X2 [Diachasma alloeum]